MYFLENDSFKVSQTQSFRRNTSLILNSLFMTVCALGALTMRNVVVVNDWQDTTFSAVCISHRLALLSWNII